MPEDQFDVLSMFPNNPNPNTQIGVSDIQGAAIPGYENMQQNPYSQQVIDRYNSQFTPQAIGPQGAAALYPGLSQDINVGTYSGSIVGNNPIFVPSGNILAIDPILARQKAIDDAARAKAASIKPFSAPKVPEILDKKFQKSLDDQVYSFHNKAWNDAYKIYGKDASVVLSDPNTPEGAQYLQTMANFNTLAGRSNQIINTIADMESNIQSKKKNYSPQALKLYNEVKSMTGDFLGGNYESLIGLEDKLNQLNGYKSFEDYIQNDNFLKDFNGRASQFFTVGDNGEYYKYGTNEKVEFGDAINQVVDSLAAQDFAGEIMQGYYNKQYMKDAIRARLQDQQTVSGTGISQKTAQTVESEREEDIPDFATASTYHSKEDPGSALSYWYNHETGKRDGQFDIGARYSFQMGAAGPPHTIYERQPDGKFVQSTFNGHRMDGVQVIVNEDGKVRNIPGSVYANYGRIITLADGSVVQQATIAVPTKTSAGGKEGASKITSGASGDVDSYTVQDVLIPLQFKNGQESSMKTQIQTKIKGSEAKKKYEAGYEEAQRVSKEVRGSNQPQQRDSDGNTVKSQDTKVSKNSDPLGLGL